MRAPLAFAIAALLLPYSAFAQLRVAPRPDLSDSTTRACIAALPSTDLAPALVSLGARSASPSDSGAVSALFLLAQDVATRLREQIGAAPGVVPNVDSLIPWTAVWGGLHGELSLDGTVTITPRTLCTVADSLAVPGDSLIRRAVQSLIDDGETWPFEPSEWALAVPFELFFAAPDRTADNTTVKTWRSIGVPVFSRALPFYAPIRWSRETTGATRPASWARVEPITDSTMLQFRYDGTGEVDRRSIREVPHRPDVQGFGFDFDVRVPPRRTSDGARKRAHAAFVATMTDLLRETNWTVGRIGSCPLPREAMFGYRVRFGESLGR